MLHKQFIRRQLTSAKKQSSIFILCVALSMVTLVALRGFGESVDRALLADAQALHAGDIIIHTHYPFSEPVLSVVAALEAQDRVESARVYEFYSVVRAVTEDASLLANLKVVEPGYPFYGRVELASGRAFQEVLRPGHIIVEQNLLDRLGLRPGDPLRVGQTTLIIRDVLVHEPDRPVNFFSLGPRIFIAAADLEALDLVKKGSQIQYTYLLKVNDGHDLNRLAAQLERVADAELERVETFRTAESGIKRFFDDFIFFLSLIGIFTLLLAGIGIQSSLTAFLREKDNTVAIVKTVGATSRFITGHYFWVVSILGLLGTLLGLALGFLLQGFFPPLFQDFLPPHVTLTISGRAIFEGLLLGVFVVAAFTFLPLYRLEEFKPSFVFRKEISRLQKGFPYYLTIFLILLFFTGMVLWQLRDIQIGLYFVGGALVLIMITALLAEGVLFLLRRAYIKPLALRQALRGLFRPRNATRAIVITLATSLAVIFAIYLIERNLDATFIQSYPEDAPNLFVLDIQPAQLADFSATLDMEAVYYPIVRGTISTINGQPIDREQERGRDDNGLARNFVLTYRNDLIEGEMVVHGETLYRADWPAAQVSIADEMLSLRDFKLGDRINFNIQGVPLEATVSSIRTRQAESSQPLFSFVFPEAVLKDAPQTIFTGVRVEPGQIPSLQNKLVAQFPNVSVIDVTAAIAILGEVVRKISRIIRFFTLFSILAGLLIIISSVFATRFARIQEAVYFKVLGAKGRFVLQVFTLENLLLGFISAVLALFLSQVGGWLVSVQLLEIPYQPFAGASLLMVVVTMLLVTTVGLLASISILRQKPISFLREQTET